MLRFSPLMCKTGVCLQNLMNPLLRYRSSAKLPTVTAPQILCSSGGGSRPVADGDRRQTDGQNVIKYKGERRGADRFMKRERPAFPKSAAGTSWKTAEAGRRDTAVDDQRPGTRRGEGNDPLPDRPLSPVDWRTLKEASAKPQRFEYQMMTSLINKSGVELDIAKSLLAFVATETGNLTYELLLHYLTLCVSDGHDAEVLDLYGMMKGRFETFDTGAYTLFIKAFSRTEGWREALALLQQLSKATTPTTQNYGHIIAGAILHGDARAAWALYDEVIEKGLCPRQDTWEALFRGGVWNEGWTEEEEEEERESMSQSEYQDRLFGVLLYMRENQLYPQKALASTIQTWFQSLPGQNWKGSSTNINSKGVCACCSSELESIQLTSVEYEQLKKKIMTDVIQGRDVFNKTTPEELERFMMFVKKRPAFDVVIDGLNIGIINRGRRSEILLTVVSQLKRQGLNVLVLAKKRMLKWNREMALIQQHAHCFYTEDVSEDAPFLLYASLNSGSRCCFVSRDMMRDHMACLPAGSLRQLFFKWQRGHHMVVGIEPDGCTVFLKKISSYDTIIQTSGDSWHIPYDEVPQRWLCLTRTH